METLVALTAIVATVAIVAIVFGRTFNSEVGPSKVSFDIDDEEENPKEIKG